MFLSPLQVEYLPFENGIYKTEKHGKTMFPSLFFYPNMVLTVYQASWEAKTGIYDRKNSFKSGITIVHELEKVGVTFDVTGIDNIKNTEGACLFISNHMSVMETFILSTFICPYKELTYVVKESLFRYPIFKHIMFGIRAISVGRKNPKEDLMAVLNGGSAALSERRSVVVFPQSTRSVEFDIKAFNTIGVKLAKRANVPVIPLALKTDAWGNGKYLKDYGKIDPKKVVHFAFGVPLYIKGNGSEQHKAITDFITDKLKLWSET
ncbi:MAG: 1-acyl-sn-glycerol-3-phosphate acyltransferase [Nitrospirae bacterium]|nr:1-acyl-sn-glycerol-3-phosphate acyltransferase [Nitrospirota bacterium]